MHDFVITALSVHLPQVLRWAGAVAKRLRHFDIGVEGKSSGSAATDALTLADLSLQELIISALRDCDPIFRYCRVDAEESTGDLERFPADADLTIGLDPIDGTRRYRDRIDNAYSVMLHLRSKATVVYSLVYQPEHGAEGWWIEARDERILAGPDDHSLPAADVVRSLPLATTDAIPSSPKIYINGFMQANDEVIRRVKTIGIDGMRLESAGRTAYDLVASRQFCGALVHSPNVYDFPVTMHLCRILGGDAVWADSGQSVNFHQTWLDEKAKMLRLPGIVACSADPDVLQKLVNLARDWNPDRYRNGSGLELDQ